MKRRVTADLFDFLAFPAAGDPAVAPFRTSVKSFLAKHALLPPPASLFPHLLTWQIWFRVGEAVVEGGESSPAAVCLDVVEEDVARSRSVYCDQCRVVGEFRVTTTGSNSFYFSLFSTYRGISFFSRDVPFFINGWRNPPPGVQRNYYRWMLTSPNRSQFHDKNVFLIN